MAGGNVAAGPFRLATIVLACLCAVVVRLRLYRRLQENAIRGDATWDSPTQGSATQGRATQDIGEWPLPVLVEVLWWMALGLALRSFFEPVMVSYYPWPPLAVALIPAATDSWLRLITAGVIAGAVTALGQADWHGVWSWWVPIIATMLVMLGIAWRRWRVLPPPPSPDSSQAAPSVALSLAAASSRSASVAGLALLMSKSPIDRMGNT
jgi:hypothetical protein